MNSKKIKLVLFLSFFLCISTSLFSQPGNPGGGPAPADPYVGTGVPLDGGSFLLLLAGIAYGVKQLKGKGEKVNI